MTTVTLLSDIPYARADAQAFHTALSRCGANSTFVSAAGAGHDDPVFDSAPNIAITAAFLRAILSSMNT